MLIRSDELKSVRRYYILARADLTTVVHLSEHFSFILINDASVVRTTLLIFLISYACVVLSACIYVCIMCMCVCVYMFNVYISDLIFTQ